MAERLRVLESRTTLTTFDSRATQRLDWLEPRQSAPVLDDGMGELDAILGRIGGGGIDVDSIVGGGGPPGGTSTGSFGIIGNPAGRLAEFWGLGRGTSPEGWNMGVPVFNFDPGLVATDTKPKQKKKTESGGGVWKFIEDAVEDATEALERNAEHKLDQIENLDRRRHLMSGSEYRYQMRWAVKEYGWALNDLGKMKDFLRHLTPPGPLRGSAEAFSYEIQRQFEASDLMDKLLSGPAIAGGGVVDPPAEAGRTRGVEMLDSRGSTPTDFESAQDYFPADLRSPGSDVMLTTEDQSTRGEALHPKMAAWLTLPDRIDDTPPV